jgi:DNA replication protein DnaC
MEHISEALKQIQKNTENKNTTIWSNAEEDTDSEPSCPICRGARFVHPLLATGKPDYSQVVPCICTRQKADAERKSQLQRYSNLGKLVNVSFDTLNTDGMRDSPSDREQYRKAYQATRKYAEKLQGWLVLTGPSGCGKTYLAASIASYQIENNGHVFYITTPDLLDHLRSSFSPDSDMPYDEFFEQVRNTPLLILDDLGAQSGTPWAKEKLEQLINHRYVNQLPTVVIVIGSLDDLDERIRTRLVSASPYQLCAFDDRSPLLTYSWSPEFKRQKEMTFENFDWQRDKAVYRENLKEALRLAREFAELPDSWLVFQGVNGCGKTHLAAAIVNYRYRENQPAMFIVVPDFLDHLRSTFSPESRISYDRLFEGVKNSPLLILDDFGKQTTTPWAQEKLYQVINYRYNARLPMVVTMNCSTDELDSPILSRFIDPMISLIFHIEAPNYVAGH